MRPIDAESSEGTVKLHSAIHGYGAYEAFKRIASEFYKNHTYKFAGLTLDGEPSSDIVKFTAEFWRVPDGAKETPPNDPLTLDELREMDGKPICIAMLVNNEELNSQWVIYSGNNVFINYMLNDMRVYFLCQIKDYGKTWIAYRHKKENAKNEN